MKNIFAQLVKEKRIERGLSQEKLAREVGISFTYISKIERKGQIPKIDILDKLAIALNIPPDELRIMVGYAPKSRISTKTSFSYSVEQSTKIDELNNKINILIDKCEYLANEIKELKEQKQSNDFLFQKPGEIKQR